MARGKDRPAGPGTGQDGPPSVDGGAASAVRDRDRANREPVHDAARNDGDADRGRIRERPVEPHHRGGARGPHAPGTASGPARRDGDGLPDREGRAAALGERHQGVARTAHPSPGDCPGKRSAGTADRGRVSQGRLQTAPEQPENRRRHDPRVLSAGAHAERDGTTDRDAPRARARPALPRTTRSRMAAPPVRADPPVRRRERTHGAAAHELCLRQARRADTGDHRAGEAEVLRCPAGSGPG